MSREIKFEFVARNIKFNEIVREVYTLDQIEKGFDLQTFFHWQNDNCEMLAKRQYTGLKDKNGTEIYEGDIFGNKALRCIVEREEDGRWVVRFFDKRIPSMSLLAPQIKNSEVIGNVWENPELLGGSDE